MNDVLKRIGLTSSRYLLYPANAWPHKNHRRLVEAFAAFLRNQPASDLALVLTGEPSAAFDELDRYAQKMIPGGRFGFAGYVSEAEFSSLLRNCRALIFPSQYEGFGLPVLESMAAGRAVLCSDTTSLPEVVGDAAILFNPSEPAEIAAGIVRLESDGKQRAAAFGSARDVALRYLAVFEEVLTAREGPQRR